MTLKEKTFNAETLRRGEINFLLPFCIALTQVDTFCWAASASRRLRVEKFS